jgi:hypothetical protein
VVTFSSTADEPAFWVPRKSRSSRAGSRPSTSKSWVMLRTSVRKTVSVACVPNMRSH